MRLADALSHLYVLVPVLDADKHYWVGDDEVEKLLAKGGAWLPSHPERDLIARRYLKSRRDLTRAALARLAPEEEADEDKAERRRATPRRPAWKGRSGSTTSGSTPWPRRWRRPAPPRSPTSAAATASSWPAWCPTSGSRSWSASTSRRARSRPPQPGSSSGRSNGPAEGRVLLLHGALTYRDARWHGADAAVLAEVVEHLDPDRLPALAAVVFGAARPRAVVVTTPNAEYNALFPTLPAGAFRHPDHRFEWTRDEFRAWAAGIEERHGYRAAFSGIGEAHPELGAPTQMAVFAR